MRRAVVFSLLLAIGLGVAACGDEETTETPTSTSMPTPTPTPTEESEAPISSIAPDASAAAELTGTLTIMAPAPFAALLEQAKAAFEAEHPGVTVQLNLGHVPALLTQLQEGVPGDVLLTPDAGTMGQAESNDLLAGEAIVIGRSQMALVVPAGNPAGVGDVSALGDEALRVAVCAAELPCGKLATQLAEQDGITLQPDSLEPGGSPGIVTKASTGEIDVGLVFATDVAAGGDRVEAIAIPDDANVSSRVSVAALAASPNPSVAASFVDFLASAVGSELVTAAGFAAP